MKGRRDRAFHLTISAFAIALAAVSGLTLIGQRDPQLLSGVARLFPGLLSTPAVPAAVPKAATPDVPRPAVPDVPATPAVPTAAPKLVMSPNPAVPASGPIQSPITPDNSVHPLV